MDLLASYSSDSSETDLEGNPCDLQPPAAKRVRNFPHVEGNFAAVVYTPVSEAVSRSLHTLIRALLAGNNKPAANGSKAPPGLQQQLHSMCPCTACATKGGSSGSQQLDQANSLAGLPDPTADNTRTVCAPVEQDQHQVPLHMSLSRTVAVRHAQIESLRAALSKELRPCKGCRVKLSELTCLVNDNQTRSFVGLAAAVVPQQLLQVIGAVDRAFDKHGLALFHKDPIPHVSLAWTSGNQIEQLQPWLDSIQHETVVMQVTQIICQVGKARHIIWQG